MPAIQISQLRAKVKLLTGLLDSPGKLLPELLRFYSAYSDLTFQSNSLSVKAGTLFAFRTPALMNREIEIAFSKFALTQPDQLCEFIDLLMKCPELEPRQLAATLLGALPAEYFDRVIPRLTTWANEIADPEDLTWLFTRATANLRREKPEIWLSMLQQWLESSDEKSRVIAVYGLSSMITDSSLTSLPLIFKHLQPLLLEENSKISVYLETIIERLIEKSETETIYFLKQTLSSSPTQTLIRMVRRSIPLFSAEGQESLKIFLRTR
jgi:hypothetical protein